MIAVLDNIISHLIGYLQRLFLFRSFHKIDMFVEFKYDPDHDIYTFTIMLDVKKNVS